MDDWSDDIGITPSMAMENSEDRGTKRLVPVPSGVAYRIDSLSTNGLVTEQLAEELRRVLDRFAREAGFADERPVGVFFKPGIFGHHKVGRAADIYAVGGIGLDQWKARWNRAVEAGTPRGDGREDAELQKERQQNLGWRLYRAIQHYGRWSQPYGYPIQLFGPWTRSEGPWKFISDRLLHAHRDHIHVAK